MRERALFAALDDLEDYLRSGALQTSSLACAASSFRVMLWESTVDGGMNAPQVPCSSGLSSVLACHRCRVC